MKVIENYPIKASIVILTPKDAADMLKRRNEYSRKIDYTYAKQFLDDIECGKWEENGDAIIFDSNGRLVNGSARLYAMTLAASKFPNIEFKCCVITGLDANVSFDRGKPRTTSQALYAAYGTKYPSLWADITEFLYGLTGLGQTKGTQSARKRCTRNNGLHPDHTKYVMDYYSSSFEKLDDCPAEKGTPASKQYYKVALFLLFRCGRYDDGLISQMSKVFSGHLPAEKSDKDLIKLRDDITQGRGAFEGINIDTRPGGDRFVPYVKSILFVLLNHLERLEYPEKRRKVNKLEVSKFLTEQIDMMFQPLYVQMDLEKRMFEKKTKKANDAEEGFTALA